MSIEKPQRVRLRVAIIRPNLARVPLAHGLNHAVPSVGESALRVEESPGQWYVCGERCGRLDGAVVGLVAVAGCVKMAATASSPGPNRSAK